MAEWLRSTPPVAVPGVLGSGMAPVPELLRPVQRACMLRPCLALASSLRRALLIACESTTTSSEPSDVRSHRRAVREKREKHPPLRRTSEQLVRVRLFAYLDLVRCGREGRLYETTTRAKGRRHEVLPGDWRGRVATKREERTVARRCAGGDGGGNGSVGDHMETPSKGQSTKPRFAHSVGDNR